MYRISEQIILDTLARLHEEASGESPLRTKAGSDTSFDQLDPGALRYDYLAISPRQGAYIYDLLCRRKARHIVEYGTSLGISTIYLAAAAKETGGKVIATEIVAEKCRIAEKHFREAGLEPWIELREGDATETLKDLEDGVDFLLVDGWKHLYLPILKLLESRFRKGSVIYADNASFKDVQPYIEYIRSQPETYRSERLEDDKEGSELSEYIAS